MPLLVEADEQLAEALLGDEVEPDRGLVEEEDVGLVEQTCRELAPHALTEGEPADRGVEQVGRIQQIAELADAPSQRGVVDPEDGGEHPEGLAGRQFRPELRALPEQRADAAGQDLPLLPRDESEHPDIAARGVEDAGQHLDGRGLPGPVRPDVGQALAGVGRERQVADGLHRPPAPTSTGGERLGELLHCDGHRGSIERDWRAVVDRRSEFLSGGGRGGPARRPGGGDRSSMRGWRVTPPPVAPGPWRLGP